MRGISRMMTLWIGLFAMASMTAADSWTYAAGLLAAAAVLPLAMASASAAKASRRFAVRRAPVTVVWPPVEHEPAANR
jgi:hypothetical protein